MLLYEVMHIYKLSVHDSLYIYTPKILFLRHTSMQSVRTSLFRLVTAPTILANRHPNELVRKLFVKSVHRNSTALYTQCSGASLQYWRLFSMAV